MEPTSEKEILDRFAEIAADPYRSVRQWKERSKRKVIGVFPMHVPEEIIHAAGMLPVVMWESNEPVTLGGALISPYNCAIVRSVIDDSLKGKLDFLDGMVCYDTCLQVRHLPFIIQRHVHFDYFQRIALPFVLPSPASRPFMVNNLAALKEGLEKYVGREISRESLSQSITTYNQNRSLLSKLYALRRRNPVLLRARDVLAIVQSSMLMPKEEHSQLLERLLPELERKQPVSSDRPRVVLSGSLCQGPGGSVLDLIEQCGMTVVDDDLYVGSRYFANNAGADDEPLAALADRYLQRIPPCPTKIDYDADWGDYILQMASRNGARGVISLMVKYCPPHTAYYPEIERKLRGNGVHTLRLEMEHEVASLEQVANRLQAFAETMEAS